MFPNDGSEIVSLTGWIGSKLCPVVATLFMSCVTKLTENDLTKPLGFR